MQFFYYEKKNSLCAHLMVDYFKRKQVLFMGKIINLGHASFLLKGSDFDIVVDPYQDDSVPNLTFHKGLVVDAVFCSHDHFDHNAVELVKTKPDSKLFRPVESIVPHDHDRGAIRGMNVIRMFDIDGYKVVHLGDTGCIPHPVDLEKFHNCDVLLAPINGFFTINPSELKAICNMINPRIVVPMHYFIKEKKTGYPDDHMFEKFQELFPNIQYVDKELDLDGFKDYKGSIVFKDYLQ